jgi:hypothetical protein
MSDHDADALTFAGDDETPLVYVRTVAASEVLDRSAQSDIELDEIPADDAVLYAVHDETGRRVGIFAEREMAFAAARWHGAAPVSVH